MDSGLHLTTELSRVFRISDTQKQGLARLGIRTVRDLLYHFPFRYGHTAEVQNIASAVEGEEGVFFGKISKLEAKKAWKRKIPMATARVTDESGTLELAWFNQPYIAKMFFEGELVRVEGKISARNGKLCLSNPKIEKTDVVPVGVGKSLFASGENSDMEDFSHVLYPVYPETRGVTSNWIFHSLAKLFKSGVLDELEDPLPAELLQKYSLPSLKTAIIWIHMPKKEQSAEAARKRMSFEEMLLIQIEKQKDRLHWKTHEAFLIGKEEKDLEPFLGRFPFKPTAAQRKAIGAILQDFKRGYPMSRLLEGDVGSGKTAVAAATAYAAVASRPKGQNAGHLQIAYMAPTEILAKQHFESFIRYFRHLPIQIGLITGNGCRKFPSKISPDASTPISRAQLLRWAANGEIQILVGTHALIQKSVKFRHLAYVVIDEQHRFGTNQRRMLASKDPLKPHLLSMTATPIPRTLALTVYGDLDLTLLDEMPAGRKQIITDIVSPDKRERIYDEIRERIREGRQLYVICPRINEPDPLKAMALNVKSVKEEAKRLKKDVFPEFEIGILHSKMKPAEKDAAMAEFAENKTQILVATSVVEVGVNVPNATMIIIEGAERFGLSQLHQLRGRVVRSTHQAYCYVFADSKGEKTFERLKALKEAKNGFELAEFDLAQRGAGDLAGNRQWGISDLAMEGIKNLKLVEASRIEAERIVSDDPNLASFPLLKERLGSRAKPIHFE